MEIIVWNSQGNKWNILWNQFAKPLNTGTENVFAFVCESGWAPWVLAQNVTIGTIYRCDSSLTYYDKTSEQKGSVSQAIADDATIKGYWVPWVGNLNAKRTNSRCSLGALQFFPKIQEKTINSTIDRLKNIGLKRPTLRAVLKNSSGTTVLTILGVHLISGRGKKAKKEIGTLIREIPRIVAQGTPALIVGDFNIDLKKKEFDLPQDGKWKLIKQDDATQMSGGNLDYAVLYDPTQSGKLIKSATISVVVQYKDIHLNRSDHSVMQYSLSNF